jgi:hypothetical protein
MISFSNRYILASLLGFLSISPLIFLEVLTESDLPRSKFPIPLFVGMWIFASISTLLIISIIKTTRSNQLFKNKVINIILKLLIMIPFGLSLLNLVVDQWPCFLGASGC